MMQIVWFNKCQEIPKSNHEKPNAVHYMYIFIFGDFKLVFLLNKNPMAIMEQKCGHVSSHTCISMAGNTYMYGCKFGISKIRIL